jgi:hypothetical protein
LTSPLSSSSSSWTIFSATSWLVSCLRACASVSVQHKGRHTLYTTPKQP